MTSYTFELVNGQLVDREEFAIANEQNDTDDDNANSLDPGVGSTSADHPGTRRARLSIMVQGDFGGSATGLA